MNYKIVLSILGKVLLIEALLMILPLIVSFIYANGNYLSFLIPVVCLIAVGLPLSFIKNKDGAMYAKEGFVTVALSWIVMSLVGAVPFVISGTIPSYIDAFFETVSGFTTTGATILTEVEPLSESVQFWRLFTHWIGGMGILVFVLAIVPGYNAGIMHVFRAESPGPNVGKLVSKLTRTARVLYGIYFAMTALEVILLLFGGNSFFDSLLLSFSTAGTGGFGVKNDSAASYSLYTQMVLAVFMFLFGANFNVYYLILVGSFAKAFKSEEVRIYLAIIVVATLAIAINLISQTASFGQAVSLAFFQVSSISSTTGLTSADFDAWPAFSQAILMVLTIIGACGGSTGGGIKVARLGILAKTTSMNFKRLLHPRSVNFTTFEGEVIDDETSRNVKTYIILWIVIVVLSTLILSLDFSGATVNGAYYDGLYSNFSATLACIGNVGPGFEMVGPMMNYAFYSPFSKLLLSAVMLIGRLEIFPMLILFTPRTWKKA